MTDPAATFALLVGAILERTFRQNSRPWPPDGLVAGVAARLWALVAERGLPRPLAPAERGAPGGMTEAELAPLVERVLADTPGVWRDEFVAPVGQLVKACFYPEFKTCRDSFRACEADGTCRRQELARARGRISGVHCVDCPHWVALTPEPHARYLAKEWRSAATEFAANHGVFLPEDFRAFRIFLHQLARNRQ